MFRRFASHPLCRRLHSQASFGPRPSARYAHPAYALGASVTVAGYLAWSWRPNSRHISLDSEAISAPKKRPASSEHASVPRPFDPPTSSAPWSDAHESVIVSPADEESSKAPTESPIEGNVAQGESSDGAFNPETGEINWGCPCLGGMAYGPCGQQFREAFSCFVYSEADPKGIDCVEKFKAMQDCFREHPDVYSDEIMDDDDNEPPVGSLTTEDDLHPTDSLLTEKTKTPPTSASS